MKNGSLEGQHIWIYTANYEVEEDFFYEKW